MLSKTISKGIIYFMLFEMLVALDYIIEIIIPCICYFYTEIL